MTTAESRKNEFQLLIAPGKSAVLFEKRGQPPENFDILDPLLQSLLKFLDVNVDQGTLHASGELFWDDGDAIIDDINLHNYFHFKFEFFSTKNEAYLKINQVRKAKDLILPSLDNIEIFGYEYLPNADTIKVDGNEINEKLELDRENNVLNITSSGLIDLNKNGPTWMLTWNNLS